MSSITFSDVPQDLSARFKTVSVQTDQIETEPSSLDVVKELLTGFSERQIRVLMGVLSQFLWKNNTEIPESENSLLHGIKKVTSLKKWLIVLNMNLSQEFSQLPKNKNQLAGTESGWTPLEPETPPISPPLNSLLHHSGLSRQFLSSSSRSWTSPDLNYHKPGIQQQSSSLLPTLKPQNSIHINYDVLQTSVQVQSTKTKVM